MNYKSNIIIFQIKLIKFDKKLNNCWLIIKNQILLILFLIFMNNLDKNKVNIISEDID